MNTRPTWARRLGAALTLAAAMSVVGSASTFGHHDNNLWGSSWAHICDRTPLAQCIADNTTHVYDISSALTTWADASRRGFNLWGNNTDINVLEGSGTDVYVTALNRPDADYFAWTQCAPSPTTLVWGGTDATHTRSCRPQWFVWNSWTASSSKINSLAKRNYIGCHETGHTIGLRHVGSGSTCLRNAPDPPSDPGAVVPGYQNPLGTDYTRVNVHY